MTGSDGPLSTPAEMKAEDAWHYPWADPELNKTARFLNSLAESKIETTKCKECSTLIWPPRSVCPKCLSLNLRWVPLPKKGELVAFTLAYIGGTHDEKTPIIVGAIQMQGGVRLLGRISGVGYESLRRGMKVKFASARLVDGKPYWEFTPVTTGRK